MTSIGHWAFYGCSGLTKAEFASIESLCNISFGNAGANPLNYVHHLYIDGQEVTDLVIPNNVTSIGSYAFSSFTELTSITIPNGVTSIGVLAFNGCSNLTKVTIDSNSFLSKDYTSSDNLSNIFDSRVTEYIIGNTVKAIGEYAFSGCTGLTSVTIPKGVLSIRNTAFEGCTGLIAVTINSNSIVSKTYSYDSNIRTIFGDQVQEYIIGNTVMSIGEYAFAGSASLTSVTIPGSVTAINPYAFSICTGLASVVIPEGMTSLGMGVFSDCTGLTSVEVPSSLSTIGSYAFEECANITQFTSRATTPPACGANALTDINKSTCKLSIPTGTISAYRAADQWKEFLTIEEISEGGDPSVQTGNYLTMNGIEGYKGKQVVLPIAMNNEQEITGLQIDLYLPDGVTVATNSKGKMIITTTERMDGNYTVSSNKIDNFVRIAGYSGDGDAFTGTEGAILNVTLDIGTEMADGDYGIQIKEIVLSDVHGTEYHPADVEATLTVKSYILGDVDNSGVVNINDVVCIINYILHRENVTFIEEAADVDGSGAININDVVVLINRYILMRDNAPAQNEASKTPMLAMANDNYLHLADIEIQPGETKEIQMLMTNANVVSAIQGNIKLPAGLSFVTKSNGKVDAKNIDDRAEDFTLSCGIQTDGSLTFAQYSGDGFTYEGNSGGIFTFKIKADDTATPGTYSIDLTEVVLSIGGVGYDIPNRSSVLTIGGTTGIDVIDNSEWNSDNKIYTIDGQQVKHLQRGVNIVRTKGGKVIKVLKK